MKVNSKEMARRKAIVGKCTSLEAAAGLVLYVAGGVNEPVGEELEVNGVTMAVVLVDVVVGGGAGEVLDGVEDEVLDGDGGVVELDEGVELLLEELVEVVELVVGEELEGVDNTV